MNKILVVYGILLAVLVSLLRYLEYRYLLRDISIEVYISIIAIFFTSLGIWLALRILKNKSSEYNFILLPENIKAAEIHKISERELEVLHLISRGYSNMEIANILYVSVNTVKTHTSNLYSKLNVKRRTAAISKARNLNLLK